MYTLNVHIHKITYLVQWGKTTVTSLHIARTHSIRLPSIILSCTSVLVHFSCKCRLFRSAYSRSICWPDRWAILYFKQIATVEDACPKITKQNIRTDNTIYLQPGTVSAWHTISISTVRRHRQRTSECGQCGGRVKGTKQNTQNMRIFVGWWQRCGMRNRNKIVNRCYHMCGKSKLCMQFVSYACLHHFSFCWLPMPFSRSYC